MTIIKTKNFTLRPISLEDLNSYFKCMQDDKTAEGFKTIPENKEEAKEEIKEHIENTAKKITEVLTIEVNGKYAGNVKLDWQDWNTYGNEGRFHIWIHPDYRKKGIATKAGKEMIKHGFENKKMKIIYAQCKESNKAICKVNEKIGFELVEPRMINGVKKIWWRIKRK